MSARTLRPTGNHVLVNPLPPPTRTVGGIMLPVAYEQPSCEGVVIAVGPGKVNRKGFMIPTDLNPGDHVVFNWIDAKEIEWEGQKLKIITADCVKGVRGVDQ